MSHRVFSDAVRFIFLGSIYAIGGWDGKHNLSTVEVLSLQGGHGDAWQPAQPLSAPR
jgi:hypothetical protein